MSDEILVHVPALGEKELLSSVLTDGKLQEVIGGLLIPSQAFSKSMAREIIRLRRRDVCDTMENFQQRVVEEKAELSSKLDKLEDFHSTALYANLPAAEQSRLTRQMYIMKLYEQVLADRISAFVS